MVKMPAIATWRRPGTTMLDAVIVGRESFDDLSVSCFFVCHDKGCFFRRDHDEVHEPLQQGISATAAIRVTEKPPTG